MTSNYKEELLKAAGNLFEDGAFSSGLGMSEYVAKKAERLDNFIAAIDRLNAAAIGEDEPIDLKEEDIENLSQIDYENIAHIGGKNDLRSELRQAFGVSNSLEIDSFKKEDK